MWLWLRRWHSQESDASPADVLLLLPDEKDTLFISYAPEGACDLCLQPVTLHARGLIRTLRTHAQIDSSCRC